MYKKISAQKIIMFLLSLSLIISLCACQTNTDNANSAPADTQNANAEEITIVFSNECETEIYGIHIEYYLADKAIGGMAVSRNPEMNIPYENGALIPCPIPLEAFTQEDLAKFKIEVFIALENGEQEIPIMEYLEWSAEFGKSYEFSLSNGSGVPYIITAQNDDVDYTIIPKDAVSSTEQI